MTIWQSAEFDRHEQVCLFSDRRAGAKAVIALHNTKRGSAVGGTRRAKYHTEQDAIEDALRLSRAMSYKSATAGLPFGGGKAILLADFSSEKEETLRCYAEWLNSLHGRFCTGEDVGFSVDDCECLRAFSRFVAGTCIGSGDPAQHTARGVFYGILAAVQARLGRRNLGGVRVAVQGVGSVGWQVCALLSQAQAKLIVSDIDAQRACDASHEFDAEVVPFAEIISTPADVFAPCAIGLVINEENVERIQARIVAGCANNQLETARAGEMLHRRGILYAPDFVINAGGLISAAEELAQALGMRFRFEESLDQQLSRIGLRLAEIFRISMREDRPPERIAEQRAREILAE